MAIRWSGSRRARTWFAVASAALVVASLALWWWDHQHRRAPAQAILVWSGEEADVRRPDRPVAAPPRAGGRGDGSDRARPAAGSRPSPPGGPAVAPAGDRDPAVPPAGDAA